MKNSDSNMGIPVLQFHNQATKQATMSGKSKDAGT